MCRECGAEQDKGLACKLRCEADVDELIATIDQSIQYRALAGDYARAAPKAMLGIALVCMFVGLLVSGWGLSLPQYDEIALLGIPFLVLGAIAIRISRRVPAPSSHTTIPSTV